MLADKATQRYDMIGRLARNMRDGTACVLRIHRYIEAQTPTRGPCYGRPVSIYDIERAVQDKATVPIYYESRIAKLSLTKAAGMIDDEQRIALIARDLVEHFERRYEAMEGKAMIVCMSRRMLRGACTTNWSNCGPAGTTKTTRGAC